MLPGPGFGKSERGTSVQRGVDADGISTQFDRHYTSLAGHIMNESYAVGWGSLALINANLAQVKGRSGLAWFLGSLIGGPIATFLLAVMDRRPDPEAAARQ
jgi:hypothetical protein